MFWRPEIKDIFSYVEDKADADVYYAAYPNFPSCIGFDKHVESVSFLSEAGFLYYLPFFLECLETQPLGYDMLIHKVEGQISRLSEEAKAAYPEELNRTHSRLEMIRSLRYGKL